MMVYLANKGQLPPALSFYVHLPFGDKIGHFILMGIFSFLATWALKAKTIPFKAVQLPLGAVIVLTLVVLEEASQAFIPLRTFSLFDLGADLLGIFTFGWLAIQLYPNKTARSDQPDL